MIINADPISMNQVGEQPTENLVETIPLVFRDRTQRLLYNFFPAPPITFPVTLGEIENFPRSYPRKIAEQLKHRFKHRRSLYKQFARQIASNARRPGRGKHMFIIQPATMDRLLEVLGSLASPSSQEVQRALWAIYYQGHTLDEIDSKVSERTISRLLKQAENTVGVIPYEIRDELVIGIPTIKISYQVLRFGRDGLFNIQPYFRGRVF